MECLIDKKVYFRHLLLFVFNRDRTNAIDMKAAHEICAVYRENTMPEKTVQWWFSGFKNGNFTLTDDERSGQPVKLDEDQLNKLHENLHQSTRKLGEQLGCDHKTVLNHLHSSRKVQKFGSWVPHSLSEKIYYSIQQLLLDYLPVTGLLVQKKKNFFTTS